MKPYGSAHSSVLQSDRSLSNVYSLSPCGHVLCLGCLQNWFRTAPGDDDDMYDDGPDSVLYRRKTCPVCRTVVSHRPIPLFLVKSIAAAIDKARGAAEPPSRSSPAPEGDPWQGIFPEDLAPEDMSEGSHRYGYDAYEDDFDDPDYDPEWRDLESEREFGSEDENWPFDYGYGSDDDAAPYEGEYVRPRWEPPSHEVYLDDYPYDLSQDKITILRRGVPLSMIDIFDVSYTHDYGMRAVVNGNVVYLGWNIELHPGDVNGEEFMEWVEADIYGRPERWEREIDGHAGTWIAWRLVREDEPPEEGEYETTDSEAYVPYEGESEDAHAAGEGYEDYYDFDD